LGITLQAVGVWTLAGSWCAAHLTDGYIPADALRMVCRRNAATYAQELVDRNLWAAAGDGWQFVDWAQWNPTKATIEAKRDANRARVEAYRRRRREV
jgi:hypothetical protein